MADYVDDEKVSGAESEGDIYDEEVRDELEEDDEISPDEEGFVKGYEEGKKMSRCPKCGKVLVEEFVEREIDDEIFRFCSAKCSENYKVKRG